MHFLPYWPRYGYAGARSKARVVGRRGSAFPAGLMVQVDYERGRSVGHSLNANTYIMMMLTSGMKINNDQAPL